MFDAIAPVYDRMNTLMTLGLDGGWRRAAVAATRAAKGDALMDVACGTGKLAAALAERVGPFGRVLAIDLAPAMIAEAADRHRDLVQLEFRVGDALALPAEDGTSTTACSAGSHRSSGPSSAIAMRIATCRRRSTGSRIRTSSSER